MSLSLSLSLSLSFSLSIYIMSLVYIYTFVDLPLFKLQTKSWMRTSVCDFHCRWRYWHNWARGFCCCSVVSVFFFFSGIFWDFPECFCAWPWASWCTQMQSMAYCSDTYTHLLIDYKEHADVSITDSLGQTGTSNMAHHHSFPCSVGGLYHTVSVSPSRRHSGSIGPPVLQPVQFIAASGSLLEHQTFTQLDIYCTHVNQNFHIAEYFQPHVLQPLITAA